jgi:hypothetical protein
VKALFGVAVVGLFQSVAAQTVPEVRDVYSSNRPASKLGPIVTPQRVVEAAGVALARAEFLQYEARVVATGQDGLGVRDLTGTVVLGKSRPGQFDQFRVTFAGRTREGESLLFVVGSDGRKLFAIDLLRKTLEEGERWEELGSAGRFARSLLLPPIDLAAAGAGTAAHDLFRFPTPETVGKELCYVVHFVDDDAAEHVYVSLSSDDGLPRRVDRVRGDAAGRPMTVTLDMWELEIDPALPADTFVPFDPSGGR